MKNNTKQNQKKKNKNMLNNQSIKTRLTQNLKSKHISNAHTKQEEREKSDRITLSHFPSTPWKNLSFDYTLELAVKGKNRLSLKGT